MFSDQEKVSIISEALPYIREFSGKTFVIKYGGASMTNAEIKAQVVADIALLHYIGVKVVLVHGGGPEINQMLEKLDIESEFRDGLRITSKDTMEIVEMILTGKVQKELVGLLNKSGAKAIGLSGKDANLFTAKKYVKDGQDWGLTGTISEIRAKILETLIQDNYLPVISSIAPDKNFISHNINADNAAYKVAIPLQAEKLIYLTDTEGVLADAKDPDSLIKRLTISEAQDLIKSGKVGGGMIPKLENAIKAIEAGVKSVHILNGTQIHSLLLETFTSSGVGTMITK